MLIANSFAAGVNGATVAAGLLGTASGWQWDVVTIGAGNTLTYDTSVPFGPFPSMKLTTTATGATYGMWQAAAPVVGRSLTGGQKEWFRLWVQQAANPSAQHQVFAFTTSGTRIGDIMITTAGKLAVRDAAGTTILTSASTIPSGSWFRIEGFMLSSATVGQIELQYFSTPFATTPTETLTTTASLNTNGGVINQARYGMATGAQANRTFWMAVPAAADGGYAGLVPVALSMIAGAPTASGFTVVSKPVGGTSVRLKVATDAGLTQNVQFVAAQVPDSYGYVRHTAAGLTAATQYYCQLADTPQGGSETLFGPVARVRTLPPAGSPQSFRVSFASCIDSQTGLVSPNAAIDDWVAWNADLKIFLGDFDYLNPSATDVPTQVGNYENQIINYGITSLLTTGWGYYCRSDHDSTNTDNGDSNNAWTAANIQAALEVFPWGTLGDTRNPTVGLYQSWVVGRVRFIMPDIRNTDRSAGAATDGPSKTMLGAAQLAWFRQQLLQPEPLKVVVADSAWMGPFLAGQPDKWWSYDYERQQVEAHVFANGGLIGGLVWWHGDDHCVACCPAASNTWGAFPVYCAAPMRNVGGSVPNVAATFPQSYNAGGGDCRQYGRVTITDDGTTITVAFSGWDALNGLQRVSQTDTFRAEAPAQSAAAVAASATSSAAVG